MQEDIIEAIPHYNDNNKYICYILLKIFYFKLVKDFNVFVRNILKLYYNKTYIFEKNIQKIENFSFNINLEKLIIPHSVFIIEDFAFAFCDKLKEVIFPKHLIVINEFAFYNCFSLKEVILHKKTTYKEYSFPKSTKIKNF